MYLSKALFFGQFSGNLAQFGKEIVIASYPLNQALGENNAALCRLFTSSIVTMHGFEFKMFWGEKRCV